MNKILALVLLCSSAHVYATDSLMCSGKIYSVIFHIGSDDDDHDIIADAILYRSKKIIRVFSINEFSVATLVWSETKINLHHNHVHVVTADKKINAIEVLVRGESGTLSLDGTKYPLVCDWYR